MMFEPPIDTMVKKVGSNFELANLMAKRAKQIAQMQLDEVEDGTRKELEIAAEEIYEGKVTAVKNNLI